jgi:hypothetical protein
MPYLVLGYKEGAPLLIPGGAQFYTADLTPGTSWAPSLYDGSSSYTTSVIVNVGQSAFSHDPAPYGYQGWTSSYSSLNWEGNGSAAVSTVTPNNLGGMYYDQFRSSGKWYVEYNVQANSYASVGVVNNLATDFSEPWTNPSDVSNHIYLSTISGGVRRQGTTVAGYAPTKLPTQSFTVQAFIDLDNGRLLLIYPGTTAVDYTNYLTY